MKVISPYELRWYKSQEELDEAFLGIQFDLTSRKQECIQTINPLYILRYLADWMSATTNGFEFIFCMILMLLFPITYLGAQLVNIICFINVTHSLHVLNKKYNIIQNSSEFLANIL